MRSGIPASFIAALLWLVPALASAQQTRPPDMLVSRQLAESEGLRVGSVIRLAPDAQVNGREFRIVGIYEPTPDPSRLGQVPRSVRLHLPDLLDMTRPDGIPAGAEYVASVNVALVDPGDAGQFATDVNARMPGSWRFPLATLQEPLGRFVFSSASTWPSPLSRSSLRRCSCSPSIMLVDERRETAGVLRLIGLPVRRILVQILLEGLLVAGAGAAFGLLLAILSEQMINLFFQWRYDTALVFVRITRDRAHLRGDRRSAWSLGHGRGLVGALPPRKPPARTTMTAIGFAWRSLVRQPARCARHSRRRGGRRAALRHAAALARSHRVQDARPRGMGCPRERKRAPE